jgi:DNA-directed RNA polymerase subunit RPC12/RpoP
MRTESEYHFACRCGREIATADTEGVCPHCGDHYRLDWPEDAEGAR